MNRISLALGAFLGLFVMGCGSSGGTASYSCDTMSGGSHSCIDYSLSATSGDITAVATSGMMACTQSSGTSVSSCSHTGAVGGCKLSQMASSGGNTVTTTETTWTYSGTAATAMMACTTLNGTFVTP